MIFRSTLDSLPVNGRGRGIARVMARDSIVSAGVLFILDIAILVYNLGAETQEQHLALG